MPNVSVIMPVYNLENRMEKTLQSILSQSFSSYEIILIDDGSTDKSAELIEDFLIQHPSLCIKFLKHSKNKGVSAARNSGLKAASGDFVIFWDGDDLAGENFISDLYLKATSDGKLFDIVLSGHTEINENNGTEKAFPVPINLIKGKTSPQIACLRITGKIKPHMCSSIFRKAFLENYCLCFHEGCTAGEDVEFIIKALVRSNLTGFSDKNNYIYNIHNNMGSKTNANTSYKKIKRYTENTMAHIRTTKYISHFGNDSDLKFINDYLLLPQTIQREISLLAIKNDRIAFYKKLKDTKTRKVLLDSFKSVKIKPEIFIKSLILLFFPLSYYIYYSKRHTIHKNFLNKKQT